jgi:sortase A
MRDKRPVDEISIEDLERILAIRKREVRQKRLQRYVDEGRRLPAASPVDLPPEPLPMPPPHQHEAAEDVPMVEMPVTYDITDDVPRFEDELENEVGPRPKAHHRSSRPSRGGSYMAGASRRRATWDRILLAVEVLGVIGVVLVLVAGGYLLIAENDRIEALDEKSAAIQREADAMRPTPTPMPVLSVRLSDYVLPGGHYSPDKTGGQAAFNVDELPDSVRPLAMAQILAPQAERMTPQPSNPNRIEIATDKVSVDASIYGGDDWMQLTKGVGHYAGSVNPGEDGNLVLAAHNDIYGEIFRDIQYLKAGDEVRIQAQNGRWYTYVVYDKQIVAPSDVWVLARGNEPIVTLITCHPYRVDTQRMIVFARLREGDAS